MISSGLFQHSAEWLMSNTNQDQNPIFVVIVKAGTTEESVVV
jgi:hypothetical protein